MERSWSNNGILYQKMKVRASPKSNRNMQVEYMLFEQKDLDKFTDWKQDRNVMDKFLDDLKGCPLKLDHEGCNFGNVIDSRYIKGEGIVVTVKLYSDDQMMSNYDTDWASGKFKIKNGDELKVLGDLRQKIVNQQLPECSLRFYDSNNGKLGDLSPVEVSAVEKGHLNSKMRMVAYSGIDHHHPPHFFFVACVFFRAPNAVSYTQPFFFFFHLIDVNSLFLFCD